MRKTIIALTAVAALAGCTTSEQAAVVGGLGAGAVALAVTGDPAWAFGGALIGAVGGYVIGKAIDNRPGYYQCYDRRTGREYIQRGSCG